MFLRINLRQSIKNKGYAKNRKSGLRAGLQVDIF